MDKISIIIVNFRTVELVIHCINSIIDAQIRDIAYEIIVLDNGSEDGSYEKLKSLYPHLNIVNINRNIGFAAANNRGSELATGDYILFLNPDTVVKPGAIEALYSFSKRCPDAGAWGGRTVFADGTLNPTSVSAFVTLRSLFFRATGLSAVFEGNPTLNPDVYPTWNRDTERKVDVLFFCFVLVRADVWLSFGGFDERFFMFCEDDDICWRMEKSGLDRMFTPEACIVHYGGASTPDRPHRIAMLLSARLIWIALHWNPVPAFAARFIICAGVFGRMLWDKVRWPREGTSSVWEKVWADRTAWARYSGQ